MRLSIKEKPTLGTHHLLEPEAVNVLIKHQVVLVEVQCIVENDLFFIEDHVFQGRHEDSVHCNPQRVFHHRRNDLAEQRRGKFQTRISIDFNEPNLKIIVNHEIQPKNLIILSHTSKENCLFITSILPYTALIASVAMFW